MIAIHHYIRYLIQFPYTPHLQGELRTHGHEDKRVDEVVVGEEQPQIDAEGVGRGGGYLGWWLPLGPEASCPLLLWRWCY
jgi:hypothetical protein